MLRAHLGLRTVAFLSLAALGVHELRYVTAFGGDAAHASSHHGHGYLGVCLPVVVLLTALALGRLLAGSGSSGPTASHGAVRVRRAWPAATVALLAIYVGQELLEGMLAEGHPGGWEGVFGAGGWMAVPLAVVFGAIAALALRAAGAIESSPPFPMAAAWNVCAPARESVPAPTRAHRRPASALAEHLAGRSPPRFSV
jgi:hypothetical protein